MLKRTFQRCLSMLHTLARVGGKVPRKVWSLIRRLLSQAGLAPRAPDTATPDAYPADAPCRPASWQEQYRLHNGSAVERLEPLTLATPAARWSYAMELPLAEIGFTPPVALEIELEVLQGTVGIGQLHDAGSEVIQEQLVSAQNGSVRAVLTCPAGTRSVIVRNASPTSQVSRVAIHALEPVAGNSNSTDPRRTAATLESIRLRLAGFHQFGTPFHCEDSEFEQLRETGVRDVILDAVDLSQLANPVRPDISRLSFYRAMLATLLSEQAAPLTCRVLGESASTLASLLAGGGLCCPCTDVRQLAAALLRHGWAEFVAEHAGDPFDALICVNTSASSLLVRRAELLNELAGLPRQCVLMAMHVDPASLAAEEPTELPIRLSAGQTLVSDALVRERLHRAGFFDVAGMQVFADGVPQVAAPTVTRAGHGGFAYLDRTPIAVADSARCEVWYLGARRPLPARQVSAARHAPVSIHPVGVASCPLR